MWGEERQHQPGSRDGAGRSDTRARHQALGNHLKFLIRIDLNKQPEANRSAFPSPPFPLRLLCPGAFLPSWISDVQCSGGSGGAAGLHGDAIGCGSRFL